MKLIKILILMIGFVATASAQENMTKVFDSDMYQFSFKKVQSNVKYYQYPVKVTRVQALKRTVFFVKEGITSSKLSYVGSL